MKVRMDMFFFGKRIIKVVCVRASKSEYEKITP